MHAWAGSWLHSLTHDPPISIQDLEGLKEIAKNQLGKDIKDLPMSVSGRNWGAIAIHNGSLMFTVDNKVALDIPMRDISQVGDSSTKPPLASHHMQLSAHPPSWPLTCTHSPPLSPPPSPTWTPTSPSESERRSSMQP
jgi:hypothetical protein